MSTITLTFCDRAENHIHMEQIGELHSNGFSLQDLIDIKNHFKEEEDAAAVIHDLSPPDDFYKIDNKAYLLIIKNGVDKLINNNNKLRLKMEQFTLKPDSKVYLHGKVVNKIARHNLCFDSTGHPPDYINKKGTVIAYDKVPFTNLLKQKIEEITKQKNFVCEGNYYYDLKKCGINFHGDTERKKVIGVRLGNSMPLYFQWFLQNKPIHDTIKFTLNDGDIYVMSEKTVGFDWKLSFNKLTLRHAAGCHTKFHTII